MRAFRALLGAVILVAAGALIFGAATADRDWFMRHVALPAYYLPPPPWALGALRGAAAALGVLLAACAIQVARRATPGGALRVLIAIALSLGAAELALRLVQRPEPETPNPRLEWVLGAEDPRTGWSFVPRRTMRLPHHGHGRVVTYAIDAHGDRAPSQDWIEDPQAPTLIVTGESIAVGHGLEWDETFAALLGRRLQLQVVNVAEGGYGSDQAHLRAIDALARLQRPVALVSTVLPVQLHRNIQDDRARLVLRGGDLVIEAAARSPLRLRQIFVDEIPYLGEADLQKSLQLTRTVLHATAAAARARGARPLFVVPSFGPARPLQAHPEKFIVEALLDDLPYLVVDLEPALLTPWDGHPNPEGARRLADAIAAALGQPHAAR